MDDNNKIIKALIGLTREHPRTFHTLDVQEAHHTCP
jgi:hypothetical protein